MQFIRQSDVKRLINENGRLCTKEFLVLLNDHVRVVVTRACEAHNGGRKKLDAGVAAIVGISGRK